MHILCSLKYFSPKVVVQNISIHGSFAGMLSLMRREPSEPSGLVEDMEDPQDCSGFKDEDLYNVGPQGNMGIYEYSIVDFALCRMC